MSSSSRPRAGEPGVPDAEPEETGEGGAVALESRGDRDDERRSPEPDPGAPDGPEALSSPNEGSTGFVLAPEPSVSEPEADRGPEGEGSAKAKPRPLQSIVDLLHDLAIAVVVCVVLITYVVQAFKVQGTSMSPELQDGERILVNKLLYRIDDIDRGDVVVFWYPEDPELSFIKRVVGLPGETIEIVNGAVYVEGRRIEEEYVSGENADRRSYPRQEIRPGHYYVLGDNRRGSNDSRSWGLVPQRYIYGKAFVRIWPLGELGIVD